MNNILNTIDQLLCITTHKKSKPYETKYGMFFIPWDMKVIYIHRRLSIFQYILIKMLYPDIIIIDSDLSISLPSYIMWDMNSNIQKSIKKHHNTIIRQYCKTIYPGTSINIDNQWIGYTLEKYIVFPIDEYSYTIISDTTKLNEEYNNSFMCEFDKDRYIWIVIEKHIDNICVRISINSRDSCRIYIKTPLCIRSIINPITSYDTYITLLPYMITNQAFPYGFENNKDITIIFK